MASNIAPCGKAFILAILCGNPILKGAFVTLLNTVIIRLDQDIALLTAQLLRLNLANMLLNLEIQIVEGLVNRVQSELNLVLGPFQQFGGCESLSKLNEILQNNAVGKTYASFQRKLYEWNRRLNLATRIDALIKQKEKYKTELQDWVSAIGGLCP